MMKNLNPAVDKKILIILAGVVWLIVGIILCNLAAEWLTQTSASNAFWFGLFGITLALFIYHFGFLKLVKQNSERILNQKNRLCIFSFQPWKSYTFNISFSFSSLRCSASFIYTKLVGVLAMNGKVDC